ncbi:MAG: hypothetical protein CMC13_00345 [Flavobacteriaceae bacterium]|nr:hypothetical protein [Flavobacteriaceae bacterium]|tara:strand:- start:27162 stop:27518 length:357 start_codon:yes stop_codon:yes gene_type:complete
MQVRGAILEIQPVKQISERFSVQNVYIDTSNYNNMTGEKYENCNHFQVINGKVDLSGLKRGDVVDVKFYINGRFFTKKDETQGFMQTLNIASIERAKNTANEFIVFPEEQLINTEIPQ